MSQTLVVRALAEAAAPATTAIAARLMGEWTPTAEWFARAALRRTAERRPVAAVSVLSGGSAGRRRRAALGALDDWQIEWKWDGIRAQLIQRDGAVHLWSRGEELITHRFPEIAAAASRLPGGTVLDGEVLAFRDDRPMLFSALQQRIGRQKQVAQLAHAVPVVFMTYDVLELAGEDVRERPLAERRARLETLLGAEDGGAPGGVLRLSPHRRRVVVGRARGAAVRFARARRGGIHDQAPDVNVWRRAQARGLVEVEDRSVHRRRRADLRAARAAGAGPAC